MRESSPWFSANSESPLADALRIVEHAEVGGPAWNTAWRTIVDQTQPYIRRLCAARLRDDYAIDDVCQDVYYAVSRDSRAAHFAGNAEGFLAYLATAAKHRCIDLQRASYRRREESLDANPALAGTIAGPSSDDVGALRSVSELVAQLEALGFRLDASEVRLLEAVGDGESPAVIAAALGITKTAVGVRLHRLRLRMRKYLENSEL